MDLTKVDLEDRVVGLEKIHSNEIEDHPLNWRGHPDAQRSVLGAALKSYGKVDAVKVYKSERAGGKWVSLDGHLRKNEFPGQWSCLILDINDEEADGLIQVFDPVGAMASTDAEMLRELNEMQAQEEAVLQDLVESQLPSERPELKDVSIPPAPTMAWVVIGIPVESYPKIAELIESIAARGDTLVETTANNQTEL